MGASIAFKYLILNDLFQEARIAVELDAASLRPRAR